MFCLLFNGASGLSPVHSALSLFGYLTLALRRPEGIIYLFVSFTSLVTLHFS